jgi:hypothetical protein
MLYPIGIGNSLNIVEYPTEAIFLLIPFYFLIFDSEAITMIMPLRTDCGIPLGYYSFHPVLTPSFLFPQRLPTAATYIFTAPTCTTIIITSNLVH